MANKKQKVPKSPKAKRKVAVVMSEFKDKELKSSSGDKVTNPKQAIAIALSEASRVTSTKRTGGKKKKKSHKK